MGLNAEKVMIEMVEDNTSVNQSDVLLYHVSIYIHNVLSFHR